MKAVIVLFLLFPIVSIIMPVGFAQAQENEKRPLKLEVLIQSYEREKERVLKPVERKYDSTLKELQMEFRKAGRLEDVLAVQKVIDSRIPKEETLQWSDTKWKWGSGGVLHLKADGSAMHTKWSKPGTWKEMRDGTITLISEFSVSTIRFTDKKTGTVSAAEGRSTTLTLIE